MLKKVITYEDYNGMERTEECYFNLSKSELMEMHLTTGAGLDTNIRNMVNAKDNVEIEKLMKNILVMSYGKKSDDGRLFVKNDAIREEFMASPIYDALYCELFTNPKAAADFVEGILPKSLMDAAKSQTAANAQPALTMG